ncbi:hypothetical protein C8F01DRAFT_987931, partial [Mycena amicta]
KLAFFIVNSPTAALPKWYEHCDKLKMKRKLMPRDVATRWNSTYAMLSFASEYKAVINAITSDRQLDLRKYEISDSEWVIVDDMVYALERATIFFSSDSHSTISHVINSFDRIDDLITTTVAPAGSKKRVLQAPIRRALTLAKATMNKYYSATDDSNIYRIATSVFFRLLKHATDSSGSPPSQPQAGVLQDAQVGARLDRYGEGTCEQ